MPGKQYTLGPYYGLFPVQIQYVSPANEIGNKLIIRRVIYLFGYAVLLYGTCIHDHNPILLSSKQVILVYFITYTQKFIVEVVR